MTPPAARRLAACLVAGLLVCLLVPLASGTAGNSASAATAAGTPRATAGAAARAAARSPLRVTIDSLAPSTVPRHGRVTVTGSITNRSKETWRHLDVYLFTSSTPMHTSEELQQAARTDPTAVVGARLTDRGLYDEVRDLAPGQSTDYVLSVPRKDLGISGEPGVYWFGVHVLGANRDGWDAVADGRARTFLPLMERHAPHTELSVAVPLKARVRRDANGRVLDTARWARLLAPDGRLGRLVDMAGAADASQLTWVVDPAVLDAVRSLAARNRRFSLAPTGNRSGRPEPSATASPDSGTPSGSPVPGPGQATPEAGPGSLDPPADGSTLRQEARDWLARFRQAAARHQVMTVPYGDLDVASVLRAGYGGTYRRAQDLSARTVNALGLDATPVVAPPNGYLPRAALNRLDDATTVLLSDRALPGAVAPVVNTVAGPRVVLASSSAAAGGPGPTRRRDALALRQRVLGEAAVHALSPDRAQPLVVATPQLWNPGKQWQLADFFPGLDVSWLDPVSLPEVPFATEPVPDNAPDDARSLVYPEQQRRREVPLTNLLATRQLVRSGTSLADLLTRNDTVDEDLSRVAMLASSTRARSHPRRAAAMVEDADQKVRRLLSKIRIEGPQFVTMSSEEGTITVTVINGLDEPVRVGVEADTGPGELVLTAPDPVDIPAGQRASVRLHARSKGVGVHSVTLRPTTADGRALGDVARFNVRSSHLGLVIWVIMGVGALFLVVTAAVRVLRRVRRRKATHGPLLRRERR